MKLQSLLSVTAAFVLSSSAIAENALYNKGEPYVGAMPVAIIVSDALRNSLQLAQNLGASCVGSETTACKPSISSIEIMSLVNTGSPTDTYDQFGIGALPAGAAGAGNIVAICGLPSVDDTTASLAGATKVAMAAIGVGCSTASPDTNFSTLMGNYSNQSQVGACTSMSNTIGGNAIAFAALSDTLTSGYSNVKFNGTAPSLTNLLSGDYTMFGDVHASGFSSPHLAAAGDSTPQHKANRGSTSSLCAAADVIDPINLGSN
jgi:hypothetical protein